MLHSAMPSTPKGEVVVLLPSVLVCQELEALPIHVETFEAHESVRIEQVRFAVAPIVADELRPLLPRLERLEVVQALACDSDSLAAILPPHVTLCRASGLHGGTTADWISAAILSDLSGLDRRRVPPAAATTLEGRTTLIVGYGSIGRAVEARLRPFGIDIVRVGRVPNAGTLSPDRLVEVVPRADAIVLLLPRRAGSVFGACLVEQITRGCVVVDAASPETVDQYALLARAGRGEVQLTVGAFAPANKVANGSDQPWVRTIDAELVESDPFIRRCRRWVVDQLMRYLRGEPLVNAIGGLPAGESGQVYTG